MGSVVLLTRTILVILSTCYTNGLELADLYPYGTEHGDATRIGSGLPIAPLLAPINNLVGFGPANLRATRYELAYTGYLEFKNDGIDLIYVNLLFGSGPLDQSRTKIHGRNTADPDLLKKAMDQINEAFSNVFCSTSPPTQLIIVTWIDFAKAGSNLGSNFQLIVVTNGNITFGIALYVNVDASITSATTGIESEITVFPRGNAYSL
ncbi:PREDICTED: uncharacterized protein LOC109586655 isoform X1 [Amphimedon queenslandica]|uniref:NIDO domain-containing protein n=1 Tax=Amphimedon queenslandica TaxID=400682 RepID=A0AAN0JN31_AMPQE|nr:PREDICTED: uncharacterized protein LOC109586655 isoform X1 [Amphimedon queenslandica]|eukprot:XP_019858418.1 PREDICTED: uncharacterized protein LOC109586655 isoform X1 [Amphimedon queenslandica]